MHRSNGFRTIYGLYTGKWDLNDKNSACCKTNERVMCDEVIFIECWASASVINARHLALEPLSRRHFAIVRQDTVRAVAHVMGFTARTEMYLP